MDFITTLFFRTFRTSIYSSLKSDNTISLSRKSSSIKPNTRPIKKDIATPQQEEDEEIPEKEIAPMENLMDASAMDTSEIGT